MKKDLELFLMILCFVALNVCSFFYVQSKFNEMRSRLDEMRSHLDTIRTDENLGIVDIYYYTNCKTMTDDTPDIMANGRRVFEGAIAISRDLQKDLMFGDTVKLNGMQFIVSDLMNKRHIRSVDIFTTNKKLFNVRRKGRLFLLLNKAIGDKK